MPCCITENDLKYKIDEDEEGKDIYEVIEDCLTYNATELQYVLFGCIPHLIKGNEELLTKVQQNEVELSTQQTALEKQGKVIDDLLERIEALERN